MSIRVSLSGNRSPLTSSLSSETSRLRWLGRRGCGVSPDGLEEPVTPDCIESRDDCGDLPTTCEMLDIILADDGCSKGECTDADKAQLKPFLAIMVSQDMADCPVLDPPATDSGANTASLAVSAAVCALMGGSALLLA